MIDQVLLHFKQWLKSNKSYNIANLRNIEPVVSETHRFGRVLDRIFRVPVLPVGAEAGRDRVNKRAHRAAVVPVGGEVCDRQIRHLRLDPVHQPLFRGSALVLAVVAFPHGHRDRVVQDQGPY